MNADQLEELEVLCSIYAEDFTTHDEEKLQYSILVKIPEDENLNFDFYFEFVDTYPHETGPIVRVSPAKTSNNSFPSFLLQNYLTEEAMNHLGMAQIYTLISFSQDWLLNWQRVEKEKQKIQETIRHQQEAALIDQKTKGTPVTKESFMTWRKAFEFEMEAAALSLYKKASKETKFEGKTGRQLFEADRSLATSDVKESIVSPEEDDSEVVAFDADLYKNADLSADSSAEES